MEQNFFKKASIGKFVCNGDRITEAIIRMKLLI